MSGYITGLDAAATLTGDELLEIAQLSTVDITAITISAAAADNSYNDSAAGFVAAGFVVGDRVNVIGFTGDVANNILVGRIDTLTTTKMTIASPEGDVIVDDAAGESVTITKWNSRRTTAQDIADLGGGGGGVPSGTSFPGSPTTGDLFYRTDRHIEYFYDGTRWLSRQLYATGVSQPEGVMPNTASTTHWVANPFNGVWDIYIETFKVAYLQTTATPATNYFSSRLGHTNPAGAGSTNLGAGVTAQNNTQNHWTMETENINTVVASTAVSFAVIHTESGTASAYMMSSFTYRLVG